MKTKTFTLLCLLVGIAVTQLSAQNRTIVTYDSYQAPNFFAFPIICDGEYIDWLYATDYTIKNMGHFKDDNFEWFKSRWTDMVLTSDKNGELFIPQGGEKGGTKGSSDDFIWEIKVNLKGSMGTQYMVHLALNMRTGEIEANTNCH